MFARTNTSFKEIEFYLKVLTCDHEQKPKAIKSFGIRISPLLESANIKPQNIEKHYTPNIPALCMKPSDILFDLHSGKKSESNPHILKDDFRKMQSRYKNYQQIILMVQGKIVL